MEENDCLIVPENMSVACYLFKEGKIFKHFFVPLELASLIFQALKKDYWLRYPYEDSKEFGVWSPI